MKKYLDKALQDALSTWTMLTIEILAASLLYASLSTFGVSQSISLLISSSFAIVLISIGLLSGYKVLPRILAKPKKGATISRNLNSFSDHLSQSMEQTKSLQIIEAVKQLTEIIAQQNNSFHDLMSEQNTLLNRNQQSIEKLTQNIVEQQESMKQFMQSLIDRNTSQESTKSTQYSSEHEGKGYTYTKSPSGAQVIEPKRGFAVTSQSRTSQLKDVDIVLFFAGHEHITKASTTPEPLYQEDAKILFPNGEVHYFSVKMKPTDKDLEIIKSATDATLQIISAGKGIANWAKFAADLESTKWIEALDRIRTWHDFDKSSILPDHPSTASSLNDLAFFYHKQGKYEQAEPLYQRALAIYERVLGVEHPDTASSLGNLALLYYSQRKYEQAEPLYQRALAIRERVLGAEHPDTKQVRENYTEFLQKMNRE